MQQPLSTCLQHMPATPCPNAFLTPGFIKHAPSSVAASASCGFTRCMLELPYWDILGNLSQIHEEGMQDDTVP